MLLLPVVAESYLSEDLVYETRTSWAAIRFFLYSPSNPRRRGYYSYRTGAKPLHKIVVLQPYLFGLL